MVRVVWVLLVLGSGFGFALYVLAWFFVPIEGDSQSIATRAASDRKGIALALALVPALVAVLLVASLVGANFLSSIAWAFFVGTAGLVLIYRNADHAEREWLRHSAEPITALASGQIRSRRIFALRLGVGIVLLGIGVGLLVLGHTTGSSFRPIGAVLLVLAAIVLLFGPWWLRIARDLAAERQARVRAEERADVASRVHDSVLQTLALIQRSAGSPQEVVQLARAQERELRSWLFDGTPPGSYALDEANNVADAIERVAREVERAHRIPIENVTVGDCPLDENLRALVAAAREATMNAAKWSGADLVSIFAEVEPKEVSVFVRDRGTGFDPAQVAPDRRGIAGSIRARISRHGGVSTLRSTPAEGTEVELIMPRRSRRMG